MKTCPYCKEEIHEDAIKCRHCHSMLLPLEHPQQPSGDNRITYILDRDLVRFIKFTGAVLAVFVVVGAYLFGFKLESSLDKVRTTQEELKETQGKLTKAHKDLESTQEITENLKQEVNKLLAQVKADADYISDHRQEVEKVVNSLGKQVVSRKDPKEPPATARRDIVRTPPLGKYKLWESGSIIRVRFMDGDAATQNEVIAIASEWIKHANIEFAFGSDPDAEIRIKFDRTYGNWSYVGTDALGVPDNMQTMNLALTDRPNVLKEFGHALGLVTEHQNPNADIPWNEELVVKDLSGPPNFWSRAQIDHNVLRKYEAADLPDYREFDPDSVMCLSFPVTWTGGLVMGTGKDLSESDKAFIARLYP